MTNSLSIDEINKLEQENKELKKMYRLSCLKCEYKNTKADVDKNCSALEDIRTILNKEFGIFSTAIAVGIIDEVLK